MSWNYYVKQGHQNMALTFITTARQANLKVITWCSGDHGVTPLDKDVIVLRPSGYMSRRLASQYALPIFIDDPLKKYFSGIPVIREKQHLPVVGFCGQAYSPPLKIGYDLIRNLYRWFAYHLKMRKEEPEEIFPSSWRRVEMIKQIQRADGLKHNFILRKKYRAGSRIGNEREASSREYFQNMVESDYILCMRGNGNFSARLYETMAMGRIPVIVNADGNYPFEQKINWNKLSVWVEDHDRHRIAGLIKNFHDRLSESEFVDLQKRNRQIWEKRLSMPGFMTHLTEHLV